jgi:hypothetical protein
VRVINPSVVGPADTLLGKVITAALKRGIVVVGARDAAAADTFPTVVAGVIAVAAQRRRELDARSLADLVRSTAHPVADVHPMWSMPAPRCRCPRTAPRESARLSKLPRSRRDSDRVSCSVVNYAANAVANAARGAPSAA